MTDSAPVPSPAGCVVTLDDEQRRAVRLRSPVTRVLGAPGTGKTTVAVAALLDRIDRDGLPPGAGVVLTPTRRQAGRLRDRLVASVGATTGQPMARSVASFAHAILADHAQATGEVPPRLLTGADQDTMMRELLAGHAAGSGRQPSWPVALAGAIPTKGFRAQLRELISRAVDFGLDAADLALLGLTHGVPEWVCASRVLAEYDEVTALSRPGWYDPAHVLGAAAHAVRAHPGTARRLADRVRFVAVDDGQDLSVAAADLLTAAVREAGVQLLVVGDPDAAVQAFRGAAPRLVSGAWDLVAAAPTVLLRHGYRQRPELAAVTDRVAERIGSAGAVSHRKPEPVVPDGVGAGSQTPHPPAVDGADQVGPPEPAAQVAVVPSGGAQARLVSSVLRAEHDLGGLPWSQLAVVVRGREVSRALRRQLSADGIPLTADAAAPLAEEPAVRPLLLLARAAVAQVAGGPSPLDAQVVVDVLTSPVCAMDSLRLRALRRLLRRADRVSGGCRSADELLVAGALGDQVVAATGEAGRPLRRCATAIAAGRQVLTSSQQATPHLLLWAVWSALEVAQPWREVALAGGADGRVADRHLNAVVALFKAATDDQERAPGRGPAGFLELVLGHEVESDRLVATAPDSDAVTITTPAGAAGRSWRVVVVAGVQQGVWPDLRLRGGLLHTQRLTDILTGREVAEAGPELLLHDELRLFHVAVSRARDRLLVTAVRNDDETPSALLDLVDPPPPDRDGPRPLTAARPPASLPEAVAQLRRRVVGSDDPAQRDAAARGLAVLARRGVPGADPSTWWAARPVTDWSRPRRDHPGEVVVSPSHLGTLEECELRWFLTTCGGQSDHTAPASAVGQLVHDIAATCDTGDESAMRAELARRWPELGLPDGWVSRRQLRLAGDMLGRLAAHDQSARQAGWRVVAREVDLEAAVAGVTVRGRLDRVERDGQGRVRVVDLKTGTTKPTVAQLARHPQLAAYQLLVGRDNEVAGAALLQLGRAAAATRVDLQVQDRLDEPDGPGWAQELVARAGSTVAGSQFEARPGPWCRTCPTAASCPSAGDTGVLS